MRRQSLRLPSTLALKRRSQQGGGAAGGSPREQACPVTERRLSQKDIPRRAAQWRLPGVAARAATAEAGEETFEVKTPCFAEQGSPPAALAALASHLRQVQLTDRLLAALRQQQQEGARLLAQRVLLLRPPSPSPLHLPPRLGSGGVAGAGSRQAELAMPPHDADSCTSSGHLDSSSGGTPFFMLPADASELHSARHFLAQF
jgi:hypothetical protein